MAWVPLLFLAALFAAAMTGLLLLPVPIFYAILSLLTLACYARDKVAARRHGRRTPENTLHLLALCGGWPGAWLGRTWLRHKSAKPSFRRWFWVTVCCNSAGLSLCWWRLG